MQPHKMSRHRTGSRNGWRQVLLLVVGLILLAAAVAAFFWMISSTEFVRSR